MTDTNNTVNDSDHSTSLSVEQAWRLYQTSLAGVEEAQRTVHESLRTVVRAAGSKTFMLEGQLYQVRERTDKSSGEKIPFLCELERPPKEWLNAAKAKKYAEAEEDSHESTDQEEQPQAETQGEDTPTLETSTDVPPVLNPAEASDESEDTHEPDFSDDEPSGTVSAAGMFDEGESNETVMVID